MNFENDMLKLWKQKVQNVENNTLLKIAVVLHRYA